MASSERHDQIVRQGGLRDPIQAEGAGGAAQATPGGEVPPVGRGKDPAGSTTRVVAEP